MSRRWPRSVVAIVIAGVYASLTIAPAPAQSAAESALLLRQPRVARGIDYYPANDRVFLRAPYRFGQNEIVVTVSRPVDTLPDPAAGAWVPILCQATPLVSRPAGEGYLVRAVATGYSVHLASATAGARADDSGAEGASGTGVGDSDTEAPAPLDAELLCRFATTFIRDFERFLVLTPGGLRVLDGASGGVPPQFPAVLSLSP